LPGVVGELGAVERGTEVQRTHREVALGKSFASWGRRRLTLRADPAEVLQRLAREGVLRLLKQRLEFLATRGPLRGPVTDAGTRAVQQQRGERA
jgi:hypothetical protein